MSNFKLDEKGVWFLPPSADKELPPEWVCSYLKVIAITKDDRGENFGRFLEVIDVDKCVHTFAMPMKMLAGDTSSIREILYSKGLLISSSSKAKGLLTQYLQEMLPAKRILCVDKTGWFRGAFILPTETIGDFKEECVYQSDSLLPSIYEEKGTLEEWKERIAGACKDNARLIFSVSCAFAAPLLEPLNMEGGGFHFYGPSSQGKTTLLRVAASVWGGEKFFLTWRSTANALESSCVQHNDSLMALDELSQITPEHASECSYMVSNGQGKARSTKQGDAKVLRVWRTFFLSTGEITLAQHLKQGKREIKAGQEIRIINIPSEAQFGIFDNVYNRHSSTGAEFSDYFKDTCKSFYGLAGKEFLRKLVASREASIERSKKIIESFIQRFSQKKHSQLHRVVKRFALVAAGGILASQFEITGWDEEDVIWAVESCLNVYLAEAGDFTLKEEKQVLSSVKAFLENHASSRLAVDGADYQKIYNQAGFIKKIEGKDVYCIFQETFKNELCNGELSFVVKVLSQKEWLIRDSENSPTKPIRISNFNDGEPSRFYCLDVREIFGEELQN